MDMEKNFSSEEVQLDRLIQKVLKFFVQLPHCPPVSWERNRMRIAKVPAVHASCITVRPHLSFRAAEVTLWMNSSPRNSRLLLSVVAPERSLMRPQEFCFC
jgi:hypothetical protein